MQFFIYSALFPLLTAVHGQFSNDECFACVRPLNCEDDACTIWGGCGAGVPSGYYPDLTNCNSYCFCTGTTAPSRYETCNPEEDREWDTHLQGTNWYLEGIYGENGLWGTNGGGCQLKGSLTNEGNQRPGCNGNPVADFGVSPDGDVCRSDPELCTDSFDGLLETSLWGYGCGWGSPINECNQTGIEDGAFVFEGEGENTTAFLAALSNLEGEYSIDSSSDIICEQELGSFFSIDIEVEIDLNGTVSQNTSTLPSVPSLILTTFFGNETALKGEASMKFSANGNYSEFEVRSLIPPFDSQYFQDKYFNDTEDIEPAEINNITSILMIYSDGEISVNVTGMNYTNNFNVTSQEDFNESNKVCFSITSPLIRAGDTIKINSATYTSKAECPSQAPSAAPSMTPSISQKPSISRSPSISQTPSTLSNNDEITTQDCFSSHTTATVEGKGAMKMSMIAVGDKVLTGKGKYETVYAIDHRHTTKSTKFLQIYHENHPNNPLEVTPRHMIFVDGTHHPIPASTINVGDKVKTLDGPCRVLKISTVIREGIFNPLTTDGTIVVSDTIASTYSSLSNNRASIMLLGEEVISYQSLFDVLLEGYKRTCMTASLELCKTNNEKLAVSDIAWRTYKFFHNEKIFQTSLLLSITAVARAMRMIYIFLVMIVFGWLIVVKTSAFAPKIHN